MKQEGRTPEGGQPGSAADAAIERLTADVVEVVNTAPPEQRQDLREYAIGLLKEGTEIGDAPEARADHHDAAGQTPLGLALLLGVVGLPAALLFPPVGLTLLVIAAVMGVFGIVDTLRRR